MAEIEADADVVEVRRLDHLDQFVGSGQFVRYVLQKESHAQRFRKGAQMLDGGHRRFKLFLAETLVGRAEVLNQKAERNLLRNLESTLDLVHGFDPGCAV